jgi:hypothetical protein
MGNSDIIQHTAPELITPHRSDLAIFVKQHPQGPDRIHLFDAGAGANGIAIAQAFWVRGEPVSDRDRLLADHPALAIDRAQGACCPDRAVGVQGWLA